MAECDSLSQMLKEKEIDVNNVASEQLTFFAEINSGTKRLINIM